MVNDDREVQMLLRSLVVFGALLVASLQPAQAADFTMQSPCVCIYNDTYVNAWAGHEPYGIRAAKLRSGKTVKVRVTAQCPGRLRQLCENMAMVTSGQTVTFDFQRWETNPANVYDFHIYGLWSD